jgi:hypothetical protein
VNDLLTTVVCAVLLGPLAAFAQTAARPDPSDPRLSAPPPAAESAFAGYRSFRDEPLAPWREVNDEVSRVGGHAGVLRADEAAEKQPAGAAAQPAAKAAPAHGHKR